MKSKAIICAIAAASFSFASLSFAQGYERLGRCGDQPRGPQDVMAMIPASAALTCRATATDRIPDRVILTAMTPAATESMALSAHSFTVAAVFRLNTATASMW